jgi:hypothetical protein
VAYFKIIWKWPGKTEENYKKNTSAGMENNFRENRIGHLTISLKRYLTLLLLLKLMLVAELNNKQMVNTK